MIPLNPPATGTFVRHTIWSGPPALKYWHLASLDAPTVAVTWTWAFAWAAHVRLAAWAAALLALFVWAIYVMDRLMDARSGLTQMRLEDGAPHLLQERHWFHWRHRQVLGGLAAMAALAAGWMVESRLPEAALRRDSLVGLATLAYFSGVHGRGLRASWVGWLKEQAGRVVSRELLVGVIFSAGCVLPVLPTASDGATRVCVALAVPAAAFAALAWLNVRAIGCWESPLAREVWPQAVALAAICGAASAVLVWTEPRAGALGMAVAGSALLLAGLDAIRDRVEAVALRAAADLVLLTPLLVVPGMLLWKMGMR